MSVLPLKADIGLTRTP